MLLLLLMVVVLEMMVELLRMRLVHWWRRLLNDDRRRLLFADRLFLLLLVGFDFDRWRVGVGRNDRCSASSCHFRRSWNRWNRRDHHRMVRGRWKMRWWRIDGLQRTASTGID